MSESIERKPNTEFKLNPKLGEINPATGGIIVFRVSAKDFAERLRSALSGEQLSPISITQLPDAGPEEMTRCMSNKNNEPLYPIIASEHIPGYIAISRSNYEYDGLSDLDAISKALPEPEE